MIWTIYTIGLIVSSLIAYTFGGPYRHWLETLGTVVMCLLWPIVAGVCVLIAVSTAWDRFAYLKRARATGDWRP